MTSQTFNKNLFGLVWLAGFVGELSTLWIDIPLDDLPASEAFPYCCGHYSNGKPAALSLNENN